MLKLDLDHYVLVASDVERTIEFYKASLGAQIEDLDEWRAGDRVFPVLHFGSWKANVHAADGNIGLVAERPTAGSLDLAFVWPGPLGEARAHLAALDIEVIYGPVKQPGARGTGASIYFRDPDGNLLEFISYDDASVDEAPEDPMLTPSGDQRDNEARG